MTQVLNYFTKKCLVFFAGGIGFPKRGLKFVERWVLFLGLQDTQFLRLFYPGLKLQLSFGDHIEKYLLWYGEYEPKELSGLVRVMKDTGTYVDVGANIGYHSLVMAKKFPKSVVYSVEPATRNYEKLVHHININDAYNVKASQIAFSDGEGVGALYISTSDNSGMSGLSMPENYSGVCEQVRISTFDNWAQEVGLEGVDVIKIDVEGAELAVLSGMLNTIRLHRPILALEIVSENLSRFDHAPDQIYEFMSEHSYRPYRIVDTSAWEIAEFGTEGDLIFFFPWNKTPNDL